MEIGGPITKWNFDIYEGNIKRFVVGTHYEHDTISKILFIYDGDDIVSMFDLSRISGWVRSKRIEHETKRETIAG